MSLLLLFGGPSPEPDPPGTGGGVVGRLLRAVLDAIHKEDDRIGGRAVTRLTEQLDADTTTNVFVESTIGFGAYTEGDDDAFFLVNGELIRASRRSTRYPFFFRTLTRGAENTEVRTHPVGSIVYDFARNSSAIDHVRRGFLVDFAIGEDLQVIAQNLGLHRCPSMTEDQLRRVIKAVAYLPKNTIDAFRQALEALLGTTNYALYERTTSDPYVVFVEINIELSTDIRGRFFLNGGEPALTTGANTVDVAYDVNHVLGVYDDTILTRRGYRDGFTNYLNPGGSFLGNTITLGTSPGAGGTPVIVDYGAFEAHYLAADETVVQDADNADRWAYLADPLLAARCLLDQIRAAGVQVRVGTRL